MKITTRVWVHCSNKWCQRKIKLEVGLDYGTSTIIDMAVDNGWRRVGEDIWCPECVSATESVGCHNHGPHPAHEFTNYLGVRGLCLGVTQPTRQQEPARELREAIDRLRKTAAMAQEVVESAERLQEEGDPGVAGIEEWMHQVDPPSPPETIGDVVASVNHPYPTSTSEISEWIRSAWAVRYPAWEITGSSATTGGNDGSVTASIRARPALNREPMAPLRPCHVTATHMAHRWYSTAHGEECRCPGALFDGRDSQPLNGEPDEFVVNHPFPSFVRFCGAQHTHGVHTWVDNGRGVSCLGYSAEEARPSTLQDIPMAPPVPQTPVYERWSCPVCGSERGVCAPGMCMASLPQE